MAKKKNVPMQSPYLEGLKRSDSNFNGLIANGSSNIHSGGGFMNALTGLGTFSRDKVMRASYIDSFRITDPELAALFHGNDLAARIVELRPKEMFRRGYDVCFPDPDGDAAGGQNANAALAKEVMQYAANIRCNEMMKDAAIYGRLFGGTLLIIGANDGQDVSTPLNESRIRSIDYLNLVDRRFLFARSYYSDPFAPKYGEVESYQVTNAFGDQQNSVIHETRVLRFDGAPVEILKKRMLAGWTLSVLQRPYDVLRQFDSSFQAASNLLIDASQAVFKMKGLMEQIASGESQTLQTRMAMVDMSRSACRAVLLDEENESFERTTTSFAGVPDMLNVFMQRIASAAEMPVTILFGREPSGLSATGEADFQHFYDTIASEQKNYMEPMLMQLYKLICLAKDSPCGGMVPDDGIEIKWKPLKEPNDTEKAEIYGKMATADAAYVAAQILMPEEVALSRFRNGQLNLETEIDVYARLKMKDAELDFAVQNSQMKAERGPDQPIEHSAGETANPQQAPSPVGSARENPQSGRAP